MAITRLGDVFPAHKKRMLALATLVEGCVAGVLALLLLYFGSDIALTVIVVTGFVILQAVATLVLAYFALEPLDFLSRAVTTVSDQATDVTPPNLNGTRHEATGFKLMVDTVYKLATSEPNTSSTNSDNSPFHHLLDNAPVGVIALDATKKILYSNLTAPVIKSDSSTNLQLLFNEDDSLEAWLDECDKNVVSSQKSWPRVQSLLPDQPGRRIFDVIASYHKNGQHGIDTILMTVDRTDYYAVNEESMDFISLAAHELRGPVTVIRGYVDVLSQELPLTEDQKQLFNRLEVSANRLSGYISNILNAAKYDRRHLKLHLREDTLSNIYATIADDLSLRASTQGRTLDVSIPADLPAVAADRSSLGEVLANFVDNAIKYSFEGSHIQVGAQVDGNFVSVSVQDSGVGIPASLVGNLFTKFYRSHRSRQTVAGTGLGLYLSKAIIESHGGRVGVRSTEGEGSVFTFSVPIYSTVSDKLLSQNSENEGIIETSSGWIKNHSMIKG